MKSLPPPTGSAIAQALRASKLPRRTSGTVARALAKPLRTVANAKQLLEERTRAYLLAKQRARADLNPLSSPYNAASRSELQHAFARAEARRWEECVRERAEAILAVMSDGLTLTSLSELEQINFCLFQQIIQKAQFELSCGVAAPDLPPRSGLPQALPAEAACVTDGSKAHEVQLLVRNSTDEYIATVTVTTSHQVPERLIVTAYTRDAMVMAHAEDAYDCAPLICTAVEDQDNFHGFAKYLKGRAKAASVLPDESSPNAMYLLSREGGDGLLMVFRKDPRDVPASTEDAQHRSAKAPRLGP